MDMANIDVAALLAPPDILHSKRVLCVQPHPDDNEIGMGGTIAVLSQQGCEIHYLTVTNGDQGNLDRTATPQQTAEMRRKEVEAAGRHLGASVFHYLDHGDGTLQDVVPLSTEIAHVIRTVQPDVVFCPDPWLPYEGHYDHIVTGRAVANAFQMSGRNRIEDGGETGPWAISAIGYYFTANPNTVIDISATFEQKFEAIALYQSQMDEQTLTMYRFYFQMQGMELARDRGFAIGEGFKVLAPLHTHCFVNAIKI